MTAATWRTAARRAAGWLAAGSVAACLGAAAAAQTNEPADRQEGDQRAHVEDLARDIEGQVYDADDQTPDGERSPRDAADSPDNRKPQGSRAPG